MKALLQGMFGYGGRPRLPLLPMGDVQASSLRSNEYICKLIEEEKRLEGKVSEHSS